MTNVHCNKQGSRRTIDRRSAGKYTSRDQILDKILSDDIALKYMAIEILSCT